MDAGGKLRNGILVTRDALGWGQFGMMLRFRDTGVAVHAIGLRVHRLRIELRSHADPFWREDIDKTASLIRATREHVGPGIRLMVDAATAWAKVWSRPATMAQAVAVRS